VFDEYERQRVATLGANGRSMTDKDYRAMVRLVRHVRQEQRCDEAAAWDRLAEYGQLSIAEAAAARQRGAEDAEKLVGWRSGPNAWRTGRYDTVMAKVESKQPINGKKRAVKHDDITGSPYFVDPHGQRRACDDQGRLPGEEGYVG
jgi:hypothetical protein